MLVRQVWKHYPKYMAQTIKTKNNLCLRLSFVIGTNSLSAEKHFLKTLHFPVECACASQDDIYASRTAASSGIELKRPGIVQVFLGCDMCDILAK